MMAYKKKINVLFISGGSGGNSIIQAFKNSIFNLSSLINCYDDGKSTGKIRDFLDILGPSDIRKLQYTYIKMNSKSNQLGKIYNYRLPNFLNKVEENIFFKKYLLNKKFLKKNFNIKTSKYINYIHQNLLLYFNKFSNKNILSSNFSIINCIIVAQFVKLKKIKKVIHNMSKAFDIDNDIVLNSYKNKYLYALTINGLLLNEEEIVNLAKGEEIINIFILKNKIKNNFKSNFQRLGLKKKIQTLTLLNNYPMLSIEANTKIKNANIIIYCPGTQHSSLYPTYITKNFSKYISNNKKAFKVFVTNIHNDTDTQKYKKNDYISNAFKYLNLSNKYKIKDFFDLNIVNYNYPKDKLLIKKSFDVNTILGKFNTRNNSIHNGKKIYDIVMDNFYNK